jgi:D-glycero-D-manno-heptose 1,7-bisphosphate phosphatase
VGINPVTRAVFLDRDGVINRAIVREGKPFAPDSPGATIIPREVGPALARLKTAGYRLVVVTNQPDVGRGRIGREIVEAINAKLLASLPLDEIRVCYHDGADACSCRKPLPGLLLQSPAYDIAGSYLIGDRWKDIEAGRRAGVRAAVLIDRGYAEACPSEPDVRVPSLAAAVDWILRLDTENGR